MTTSTGAYGFAGEAVLITGGASGIGAGIAEILAEAGATAIIADIDEGRARDQAARLAEGGGKAGYVRLDLADEASIVAACVQVFDAHGAPWALVNNAGLMDRQLLLDGTAAEWDRITAVNSRGAFLMIREVARQMVTAQKDGQPRGGRIVNVASASVIGSITMGHAIYAASKSALLGLGHASALELAPHRITVNTVLPGGVATPGAIGAKGPVAEGPARRRPPLGMCEPRDIGAAVLFLASPAARSITNQVFAVDGGWSVT
jgi:NAD(P)-dependent dehydrogenase (short-subunit alcohol dehydrogenase family)